jgi:hypothetical protein
MLMSLNYVGSLTIAAGATEGIFAGTSQTATPAKITLFGLPDAGGVVQSESSAGTGAQVPVGNGTFEVGGAEVYLTNTTAASLTFEVRIASIS